MPSGGSICSTELRIDDFPIDDELRPSPCVNLLSPGFQIVDPQSFHRQFRNKPCPSACPRCPFPCHMPEGGRLRFGRQVALSCSFKEINCCFSCPAWKRNCTTTVVVNTAATQTPVVPGVRQAHPASGLSAGTCKQLP